MNSKASNPIGIFDSGIGGLTVANALQEILPCEKIVYFGDTAHLPYGDKSSTAIRKYSTVISDFLLQKKCKLIIIACNTASSVAYNTVKSHVENQVPVVDVINPVAQYVARNYRKERIGVIGTKGTINSRIYVRRIAKFNPNLDVVTMATPLLAPMIEEGFFNNYISQTIINNYLSKKAFQKIKAMVLGCTHYPLIKNEIDEFYKGKVEIIDSAQVVAIRVEEILKKQGLLNPGKKAPDQRFFVSDYTRSFEESTRFFFKNTVHLKKSDIWGKEFKPISERNTKG